MIVRLAEAVADAASRVIAHAATARGMIQITAGAGVKGQRAAKGIRLDNVGGGDDQIVKNIDLERAALVLRDSEGARE